MTLRSQAILYGASVVLHGAIAVGLVSIEERPARAPIRVAVRSAPRPATPEPEPPPPPEVPEPPPAVEPIAPAPRRAPAREAPVAEAPAAPAPAPAIAAPAIGLSMSGGTGPGIAVPLGDPSGVAGGTGTGPRVREERRVLDAAPAAAAPPRGGCEEAEVRPRALAMPPPRYTDAARAAGIEGRVRVELEVDAEGRVVGARVVTPLEPGLDEAALEAARAASFAPATRCGEPVAATFTVAIRFQL